MQSKVVNCRQFLRGLGGDLDHIRKQHIRQCPNCRVLWDTTRKTVLFYRRLCSCTVPRDVETRLLAAMESWMAGRR